MLINYFFNVFSIAYMLIFAAVAIFFTWALKGTFLFSLEYFSYSIPRQFNLYFMLK